MRRDKHTLFQQLQLHWVFRWENPLRDNMANYKKFNSKSKEEVFNWSTRKFAEDKVGEEKYFYSLIISNILLAWLLKQKWQHTIITISTICFYYIKWLQPKPDGNILQSKCCVWSSCSLPKTKDKRKNKKDHHTNHVCVYKCMCVCVRCSLPKLLKWRRRKLVGPRPTTGGGSHIFTNMLPEFVLATTKNTERC